MIDRSKPSKFDGMALGDWIAYTPDELDVDAIALEQVVRGLRIGFDLHGDDLDKAVHELLTGIMARGARPIQGCSDDGGYWIRVTRFGDDPAAIVDGVMREWHEAGVDPDIGNVWFALQGFIAAECRFSAP